MDEKFFTKTLDFSFLLWYNIDRKQEEKKMNYKITILNETPNEEPYFVCYTSTDAEAEFMRDILYHYPAFRYADIIIQKNS